MALVLHDTSGSWNSIKIGLRHFNDLGARWEVMTGVDISGWDSGVPLAGRNGEIGHAFAS
jgi:hypothetical protein